MAVSPLRDPLRGWQSLASAPDGATGRLRTPCDYRRSHRLLLLLIVAHVLVMTLFPTIARLPGAVWDDMLEAWSWGKQFELGYYKHPPLYAWIVGLWFQILPRTNLSLFFPFCAQYRSWPSWSVAVIWVATEKICQVLVCFVIIVRANVSLLLDEL
jgi:hypothetical protein